MASADDDEKSIRISLRESLKEKFPLFGENDFDFVKVRHKQITVLGLAPNAEYNYTVVKKLAGQGSKIEDYFETSTTARSEEGICV